MGYSAKQAEWVPAYLWHNKLALLISNISEIHLCTLLLAGLELWKIYGEYFVESKFRLNYQASHTNSRINSHLHRTKSSTRESFLLEFRSPILSQKTSQTEMPGPKLCWWRNTCLYRGSHLHVLIFVNNYEGRPRANNNYTQYVTKQKIFKFFTVRRTEVFSTVRLSRQTFFLVVGIHLFNSTMLCGKARDGRDYIRNFEILRKR